MGQGRGWEGRRRGNTILHGKNNFKVLKKKKMNFPESLRIEKISGEFQENQKEDTNIIEKNNIEDT